MRVLKSEPYSDTDKLADDALEELDSLGLGYGAHTVIGMALGKLKTYEAAGLTPEQVEAQRNNLDVAYKCIEKKFNELKVLQENFETLSKSYNEMMDLEEHGLLLRLPRKVWDKVFIVDEIEKEIEESRVYEINIDDDGIAIMIVDSGTSITLGHTVDEFGENIFLDRESAEKALAELEVK